MKKAKQGCRVMRTDGRRLLTLSGSLFPVEVVFTAGLTAMRGKPRYFRPGKDSAFAAGELGA